MSTNQHSLGMIETYERFLRPMLFKLDPEKAHDLMYSWLPKLTFASGQFEKALRFEDARLQTEFANRIFANPIGLAAGFDKNAKLDLWLDAIGLGFAEIGSITGSASEGNAKPRLFRLPQDNAVINRLGLNGDGAHVVAERAASLKCRTPYAINIAKTNDPTVIGQKAVEDLLHSFNAVKNLPLAYLTINASCPNTHDGITQETDELHAAMQQMQAGNTHKIPLFMKLSPDSSDSLLEKLLDLGRQNNVAGYICGNTTTSRGGLNLNADSIESLGKGGMSGSPLKALSMNLCRRVLKQREVDQSVIACGGISSGADVFSFLELGVSGVQLYTALIYKGPALIMSIKRELCDILVQRGTSVNDMKQAASRHLLGL